MKVFWSWQADTPGKTGRHFVRDALNEAIALLKQPQDIEEPSERENREALHLDHDRQGVPGSPPLAPTIFGKIEQSAVFVADVTLVGEIIGIESSAEKNKKFINSNVGIEYGYAAHALGDEAILMVQNVHYGARDDLPFDLKYKAGPIQYCLAPEATKQQIDAERAQLRSTLVAALRPYIGLRSEASTGAVARPEEIPSTRNPAFFWEASEVLARVDDDASGIFRRADDAVFEYRFEEPRAFYLRLIPASAQRDKLSLATLVTFVGRRRPDILTRAQYSSFTGRNRYGAIVYEVHGDSRTPNALTQLFRNGEIWGVSRDLIVEYLGDWVIPTGAVSNFYSRVLSNYIEVSHDLDFGPPYTVEMGAVGLTDVRLSMPPPNQWNEISGPVHQDQLRVRRVLNDASADAQRAVVDQLLRELYDLVGISI